MHQRTRRVRFHQQFLSPSHPGGITLARKCRRFWFHRIHRILARGLPAVRNVSVTQALSVGTSALAYKKTHHHQPAVVLSTDALAANGRPACLGAVHAEKSSTPSAPCPQKHSPSFNKTTHPIRAIFAREPRQVRLSAMRRYIQQKCSPSLRAHRINHQGPVNFSH